MLGEKDEIEKKNFDFPHRFPNLPIHFGVFTVTTKKTKMLIATIIMTICRDPHQQPLGNQSAIFEKTNKKSKKNTFYSCNYQTHE